MALTFPLGADSLTASASATLGTLGTKGTLIFSVYPTSFAANQSIFFLHNGGTNGIVARLTTSGSFNLICARTTSNIDVESAASSITLNAWNDIAVVWDTTGLSTDQKIYLGNWNTPFAVVGAYTTQSLGSGAALSFSAYTPRVGANATPATPFVNGRIAYEQLYTRVLSVGEMQNIQMRRKALANCVAWWELGQVGTATASPDLSLNGIRLTTAGAPTPGVHDPRPMFREALGSHSMANYVAPVSGVSVTKRSARRRRAVAALAAMGWMR